MGKFTDFITEKKRLEESQGVSGNLLKNLIDILHDFVQSEFDLSDDAKGQIISNMKISMEDIDKGSKFVAESYYIEGENEKKPVSIDIGITSDQADAKDGELTEPVADPEETEEAFDNDEDVVEDEEFNETFQDFKNKKIKA